MRLWGRTREIERALRSGRPAARAEFVASLQERLEQAPAPARPRAWSRVAHAAALAVFVLGTFASFGGVGYAAGGAAAAVDKVFTLDTPIIRVTSAADQYSEPGPTTDIPKDAVAGDVVAGQVAGDELPFTGSSLAVTFALGLALLLGGFALRRAESRSS